MWSKAQSIPMWTFTNMLKSITARTHHAYVAMQRTTAWCVNDQHSPIWNGFQCTNEHVFDLHFPLLWCWRISLNVLNADGRYSFVYFSLPLMDTGIGFARNALGSRLFGLYVRWIRIWSTAKSGQWQVRFRRQIQKKSQVRKAVNETTLQIFSSLNFPVELLVQFFLRPLHSFSEHYTERDSMSMTDR